MGFCILFLLEQDSPGMGWERVWVSSVNSGSHPVDGGAVSFLASPSLLFPWCVILNVTASMTLTSTSRCSLESEERLRLSKPLTASIEKIPFWKICAAANGKNHFVLIHVFLKTSSQVLKEYTYQQSRWYLLDVEGLCDGMFVTCLSLPTCFLGRNFHSLHSV